jgi:hypothetical protein
VIHIKQQSSESEAALLRRWRRTLRSDPELDNQVREDASRLLMGVRFLVAERECLLVERVVMEAGLTRLMPEPERPFYVM